jgi:hypothetical protein
LVDWFRRKREPKTSYSYRFLAGYQFQDRYEDGVLVETTQYATPAPIPIGLPELPRRARVWPGGWAA